MSFFFLKRGEVVFTPPFLDTISTRGVQAHSCYLTLNYYYQQPLGNCEWHKNTDNDS